MGNNINIGPFIKCKRTEKLNRKVPRYGCSNESCMRGVHHGRWLNEYEAGKFCSVCGSPICKVEIDRMISANVAIENMNQDLYALYSSPTDEFDIFFPNNASFRSQPAPWNKGSIYPATFICAEITGKDIEREKAEFLGRYSARVAQLKEIYGEENVNVLWGAVSDPG